MMTVLRVMLKPLFATVCGLLLAFAMNTHAAGKKFFDHASTGFELVGAHSLSACQNCHVQGQFLGTPRQCEGCHSMNGRFGATPQPIDHIPVTGQCDSCHQPVAWEGVVFMDHTQALGECFQCHDNFKVAGQPLDHINTVKDCEGCHSSTLSWTPVSVVNHDLVTGACISCHNNVVALGKPLNHINASPACAACHTNRLSFDPAPQVDHNEVSGVCSSCHNGVIAVGADEVDGHPKIGALECDACHMNPGVTFEF